jgi:membrane-bound serine protease (ClpP class)
MEDVSVTLLLYLLGIALLVLEIFLPSHGVLTITGLGFLGAGIYYAFRLGAGVGYAALLFAIILLPAFVIVAVKYWYRTPIGKRVAPPNPTITEETLGFRTDELAALVGQTGRCLTPLRPVGSCEFNGRRIQCMAESGVVESGAQVRAIATRGRDLIVRELR